MNADIQTVSTSPSSPSQSSAGGGRKFEQINLCDAGPNIYIDGTYSLINPQVGVTRGGKPYLKCLIRDATGEAAARHWSFDETLLPDLQQAGFAWVAGHTQLYNGQIQLILEEVRAVDVTEEDLARLLPTTRYDIDAMFAEVQSILSTLEHPAMKALADAYLEDDDLMSKFRQAPAAVSMHHAWIGGLLEHTLQLLRLANAMLPFYPKLNRDLVLMGIFLHDMGKTGELTWERGFDYTPDGNLVGHVVRGAIWLQFKAAVAAKKSGHRLRAEALRVLQHIVLSHHSLPEYGAAKIPSTPEAVFVAILDNLDAKTCMCLCAARPEGIAGELAGDFTEKVWALGTRVYRPDPLGLSDAPSVQAE